MSSPIKVGILGTGIFARDRHVPVLKELPEQYEIVACCNRTRSKAEVLAAKAGIPQEKIYTELKQLLEDPDVELIDALLPVEINCEVVAACLAAGKPIVFEKPLAGNLEDARKIVGLVNASPTPAMVLENWAHFEGVSRVRALLPKIGEIIGFSHQITTTYDDNNKYMSTSWRVDPHHVGGVIADSGVHEMALLTEILGPVSEVSALTRELRRTSKSPDTFFATFKMESGIIGQMQFGSCFGATEPVNRLQIFGRDGSIVYEYPQDPPEVPTLRLSTGNCSSQKSPVREWRLVEEDYAYVGVKNEFMELYEPIKSGDKSKLKLNIEKPFHHYAVIHSIVKSSAAGGAFVSVPKP